MECHRVNYGQTDKDRQMVQLLVKEPKHNCEESRHVTNKHV